MRNVTRGLIYEPGNFNCSLAREIEFQVAAKVWKEIEKNPNSFPVIISSGIVASPVPRDSPSDRMIAGCSDEIAALGDFARGKYHVIKREEEHFQGVFARCCHPTLRYQKTCYIIS